jgi:hypothetical protein
MKIYGGVDVLIHVFLTSALVGDEWSASRCCRFTPRETAPGNHCMGGRVGRRAGLGAVEERKISCICQEPNPGRPARIFSLYRLSHPGSYFTFSICTYLSSSLRNNLTNVELTFNFFLVRFPALPDFLRGSGSGTGSTQPREYSWV